MAIEFNPNLRSPFTRKVDKKDNADPTKVDNTNNQDTTGGNDPTGFGNGWQTVDNNTLPKGIETLLNLASTSFLFNPVSQDQTAVDLPDLDKFLLGRGDAQVETETMIEKLSKLLKLAKTGALDDATAINTDATNQVDAKKPEDKAQVDENGDPIKNDNTDKKPDDKTQVDDNGNPIKDKANKKPDDKTQVDDNGNPIKDKADKKDNNKVDVPPAKGPVGFDVNAKTYTCDPNFVQDLAQKVKDGTITEAEAEKQMDAKADNDVLHAFGRQQFDEDTNRVVTEACYKDGDGKAIQDGISDTASDVKGYMEAGCNGYRNACKEGGKKQLKAAISGNASASATATALNTSAPVQQASALVIQGKKEDPLVLDLDGNGINTSNNDVVATIDGKKQKVKNVGSGDGVVTLNGEILGDKTDLSTYGITQKPKDAQDAVNLLAQKAYDEGLISSPTNLTPEDIQVMEQQFGLAIRVGDLNGQDESFAAAGVNGMNLSKKARQTTNNFDGKNNTLTQNGTTFTRADGSTGKVGDIWYKQNLVA